MKYKHIEMMREARLWIGQIIVPLAIGGLTIWSIPEARNSITENASKTKEMAVDLISNVFKR